VAVSAGTIAIKSGKALSLSHNRPALKGNHPMLFPVILSGGSGTRLWPLSRKLYPKQLLPLVDDRTMLQNTVLRTAGLPGAGAPLIICNEAHRFLVAEQLRALNTPAESIILEPVGRNTAPAVGIAALRAAEQDPEALLLILPADHVITDEDRFRATVASGLGAAEAGKLITFGIVPHKPETGYGYIRKGAPLDHESDAVFAVDEFREKPDLATAENYLASGQYLWNSGMFLMRATAYLEELGRFQPEMLDICQRAYAGAAADLDFLRLPLEIFSTCPEDSIDYAVMEKTGSAAVIPLDAGWNDVGSWSSLLEVGRQDKNGNVLIGDVLTEDVTGSYIHAGSRLVTALGLHDHVVVETKDAVLVAARDRVQDVKKLVNQLKDADREEPLLHSKVYRPWGAYEGTDKGTRFQVKRITVKPGEVLSLQMHHHRAEHWIVVSGTARITRGDETFVLTEDQSTYIPLGTTHRMENPGKIPLELIEVQTGSYLGEDDIVRFEDVYGREGDKTKVE